MSGPTRLLVVEDEDDIREALVELLSLEGYEARGVSNGRDALTALEAGFAPAGIVLDLMMPVMNGWQLRQALLDDPRFARIPVVVVTAAGKRELGGIEADRILPKPIGIEQVLEALAELGVRSAEAPR